MNRIVPVLLRELVPVLLRELGQMVGSSPGVWGRLGG